MLHVVRQAHRFFSELFFQVYPLAQNYFDENNDLMNQPGLLFWKDKISPQNKEI
jgi:hypothetical protein